MTEMDENKEAVNVIIGIIYFIFYFKYKLKTSYEEKLNGLM